MNGRSLTNIFKGDKVIWIIFFFLCMISIIEVYSASSALSYEDGVYWSPLRDHIAKMALGWAVLIITMNIDCKYFKVLTPIALFVAFITVVWSLAGGHAANDASRWVKIPGTGFTFQPSELAKGALVLASAQVLSAMQTDQGADRKAMVYILGMAAIYVIPITLENLSTGILLCTTIFLMMIIGRVPKDQLGKLFGAAVLAAAIFLALVMTVGDTQKGDSEAAVSPHPRHRTEMTGGDNHRLYAENTKQSLTEQTENGEKKEKGLFESIFHRFDSWKSRIIDFVEYERPKSAKDYDLKGKKSQEGHASIAIATSNIVGKGLGQSTECDWLALAHTDFIYAIAIEEMGILGAIGIAMLYIFLLIRAGNIAKRCVNAFPAYLTMGLAIMFVVQALFNMLVAVGLMPVTGQPLPLISRGGTSTIVNCAYIGIILSVSRSAKKEDQHTDKAGHTATTTA